MGFWPYFLHAHRSGGMTSPPGLLLLAGGAGMQTTFLVWLFLCDNEGIRFFSFMQTDEDGGKSKTKRDLPEFFLLSKSLYLGEPLGCRANSTHLRYYQREMTVKVKSLRVGREDEV